MTDPHDSNSRASLVHAAIRVSLFSVFWSIVVGAAALVSGVSAGSLALVGFGLDSVIDSSASVVLVWRFRVERADALRAERVERVAERTIGITLVVIALYIVAGAVHALFSHSGPASTVVGDALAIASLLVLPALAIKKRAIARGLDSRALRGDSVLTAAGAVLALVTLGALMLNSALGWWWADSVAALLIAALLGREGLASLFLATE